MKKYCSKIWKIPILPYILELGFFFLTFLSLDIGIRFFSNQYTNFYSWTHASPFFFSMSWIFLFFLFFCFLSKKKKILFFSFFTVLFNILVVAQMLHQSILGRFFSVYDLFLVGEGADYFFSTLQWITPFMIGIVCTSILSMGCCSILWLSQPVCKHSFLYYSRTIILLIAFFPFFRFLAIERLGQAVANNSWDRWNNVHNVYLDFNNPSKNMEVAGLYEMTFRSIFVYIQQEYFTDTSALVEEVNSFFYNQNDSSNIIETKNTGIFKGKNLILVMMESIDSWLVTDDVMPTLSYLEKTGWNFTGRYSPAFGGGQTFNSEFAANTGLFAIQNGQAAYNFDFNSYPYSLPNLFRNSGYQTQSLHVNYGNFYNRNSIHLALGYDNHISLLDEFPNANFNFFYDSNLLKDEAVTQLIIPEESPFMNFIITYTAHMPYASPNGKCATDLYGVAVPGNSSLSCIGNLARDTDEFLKELLEKLEKSNHLEDTVLILFSDHYTYAYPDANFLASVKGTNDENLLQNVPFLIWSYDLDPQEISTLMVTTDILPTVANLFDLEGYFPNNYIATDVFSENHDPYVYFADGSWYDGNLYYRGQEVDNDLYSYVSTISEEVQDKILTNNNILLSDYYANS